MIQEPHTGVSFIVGAARKGVQALAVKIADPPPKEEEKGQNGLESSVAGMGLNDANGAATEETTDGGGWGTWD